MKAERGARNRGFYLKVQIAPCQTKCVLNRRRTWHLHKVVCRNCPVDVDSLATDFFGLKKLLDRGKLLTKTSETSPCLLFYFQSCTGRILKCLKTSTKGCCHKLRTATAVELVLFSSD